MSNPEENKVKNRAQGGVKSLSPTEQKVYSRLYSKRVITTEDVKAVLGGAHKSADYITNLRQKGYLQKIRRGVYAIKPPDTIGEEYRPDKYLVASKLKEEYFLSYHTALELHGVAQSAYNEVWITVKKGTRNFSYQDIDYRFTTSEHYFGIGCKNYQGNTVTVSDREKTLLDCIRRTGRAGGLGELVQSINNYPAVAWDKLLDYLERIDEKKLYQKTGLILEKTALNPPADVLEEIKDGVGKKTYYLNENKTSSYNKRWNLMVPKNFKELMRGA